MPSNAPDWSQIDTVLLDMDGTLLDLRFDNWFWLTFVPLRYAAAHGISEREARLRLEPKFKHVAHTLQWYCIDYWTRELGLEIAALKRTVTERVGYLPGAEAFLERLRSSGKRVVLVTNSHPETLAIKDERVALTKYFHAAYSTHSFGIRRKIRTSGRYCWPRNSLRRRGRCSWTTACRCWSPRAISGLRTCAR